MHMPDLTSEQLDKPLDSKCRLLYKGARVQATKEYGIDVAGTVIAFGTCNSALRRKMGPGNSYHWENTVLIRFDGSDQAWWSAAFLWTLMGDAS